MQTGKVIAVAGVASNVGKTTLACQLLERLPGWEAVKVTKGHYRSCGKDPHACCVSHLLSDAPLVMSGRERTYVPGKDTGRYWDAGASNVHWVVATKEKVEEGVREALSRVADGCPGVIVEGTGFLVKVDVDYAVMVVGHEPREVKRSAVKVLDRVDAIYGTDESVAWLRELLDRRLPPIVHDVDQLLAIRADRGSDRAGGVPTPPDRYRDRL